MKHLLQRQQAGSPGSPPPWKCHDLLSLIITNLFRTPIKDTESHCQASKPSQRLVLHTADHHLRLTALSPAWKAAVPGREGSRMRGLDSPHPLVQCRIRAASHTHHFHVPVARMGEVSHSKKASQPSSEADLGHIHRFHCLLSCLSCLFFFSGERNIRGTF